MFQRNFAPEWSSWLPAIKQEIHFPEAHRSSCILKPDATSRGVQTFLAKDTKTRELRLRHWRSQFVLAEQHSSA